MDIFALVGAQVQQALASNQFLSGGLVLGALGALAASCRKLPEKLWEFLVREFTVSLEVNNHDPVFSWFKEWFHVHDQTGKGRHFKVFSIYDESATGGREVDQRRVLFTPRPGLRWVWFEGKFLWVEVQAQAPSSDNGFHERLTYVVNALGRNPEVLRRLLEYLRELAATATKSGVKIHLKSRWSSGWDLVDVRVPRPLESVVLAEGLLESVIADIREFLGSKERYGRLGIPWRRQFLLWGPPGTGKSSLVAAVAGALGLDVYYLDLKGLTDSNLYSLLASTPPGGIVVLEEVDTVFEEDRKLSADASDERGSVTFSGLLNALDGIVAKEGRILFMTTNHPEKLDPALVRAGRCDRRIELGYADESQIRRQYQRFFPETNPLSLEAAVAATPKDRLPMAAIQELCIQHQGDLQALVSELKATKASVLPQAA